MSEGPLSDLMSAFKGRWSSAPLSTQRVTSHPSFWNPFHSWRDEEERELRILYESAKTAFDTSMFAHESELHEAVAIIVSLICKESLRNPDEPVIVAMSEATKLLLVEACFDFPQISQATWSRLDLRTANTLRSKLENQLSFLNDWEVRFELAMHTLIDLWISMLEAMPSPLRDDATTSLVFSSEIVSLISEPHEAMSCMFSHFISNEAIQEKGLFGQLCRQLYRNGLEASGVLVDNDKPLLSHDATNPVLPNDCLKNTASEVAQRYFRHTPLLDILATPIPLPLPEKVRFEHCHILGGTGHGKTQCLQFLLAHDLVRALDQPISIVVIDSQGDLIRNISSSILFNPEDKHSLADRFILIDPSDIEHPPALNLFDAGLERMESYTPHQKELAFNSLVDIYGRFFGALLGAELTAKQNTLFRYLARLMLTVEGATIHTLIGLMDDISPFKDHIEKLDPTARRFFENEFSRKGFHATRQQIKQRLYAVLSIPTFDRLFSAPKSKVSFFDAFNSGKIIMINTAKDLLKSDGTAIFGRFILALIEHAVMERANLAEEKRNPVFLYMDEAQDYFDETVETLLVQSRKFKFGLTLAHQSLAQLSPRLRAIFMTSTTIKLAGGVSDADARAIAPDMHTTADFLLAMKKHQGVSDFALSIRNVTAHAVKVEVPLGFLEDTATLEQQQYDALLALNRKQVGYTPQVERGFEDTPFSGRLTSASPQTGTAHRKLQKRIKAAAEEYGFTAILEKQVLDGKGRVDVALERDELRIACEVSVTTKVEHERHNIEKCLAAGFTHVWVTSPDAAQLQKLRDGLQLTLSPEAQERVSFLSEKNLVTALEKFPVGTSTSLSKVRGYTVRTVQIKLNAESSQHRHDRLATVLSSLSNNEV